MSGAGRGRGWLRTNGDVEPEIGIENLNSLSFSKLNDNDSRFSDLITAIGLLHRDKDGKFYENELANVVTIWENVCKSSNDLT